METLPIDRYLVDVLMRDLVCHDKRPSAFLVYLHLWARAGTRRERRAQASLQEIAEDTGLSKSAVQAALRLLTKRRLLRVERAHPTAVPEYLVLRPWARTSRG